VSQLLSSGVAVCCSGDSCLRERVYACVRVSRVSVRTCLSIITQ